MASIGFFLNVLSFYFDTISPTIFQLFYDFQIIRFVKPSKIPFFLPLNFFIRLKMPTIQPSLEVWEQIIVAGGQVRRIRCMRKRFKTQLMLFFLCNVQCLRWCIVIMKKDFFLFQMGPFLPDFVNQLIQLCSIVCHNFPSRLLHFQTLWCTFTRFNPLFWPFTWFRSISGVSMFPPWWDCLISIGKASKLKTIMNGK